MQSAICSNVVENHTASICRVTLFVECCNDVVEENVLVTVKSLREFCQSQRGGNKDRISSKHYYDLWGTNSGQCCTSQWTVLHFTLVHVGSEVQWWHISITRMFVLDEWLPPPVFQ